MNENKENTIEYLGNKFLKHDLLYIREHLTCSHYKANMNAGFIYHELEAGKTISYDETLQNNHLVIILAGSCTMRYNTYHNRKFKTGEMVLIPRSSSFHGRADEYLKFLDMAFISPISGCDKLILQRYHSLCQDVEYDFRPTEIRYPLDIFFNLLVYCLQNGMMCAHLHEMKHKELFFYLRGFYTKQEVTELFYPIISKSFDFRTFVLDNYAKVCTLNELIALSNMSRSSFIRMFKAEFHDTFHNWKQKQLCLKIMEEVVQPDISVKELMIKFDFDSFSNFNRFCKRHFHCTPTELLEKYRGNVP